MTEHSLEEKLQVAGSAVKLARNAQLGALAYPTAFEFTNWRDEQRAWRETAGLLDLTHHMVDLCIKGPDAIRLFSDLAVNSFNGFAPGKAKQLVCCNADGYVIGDGILFFLEPNELHLLGQPSAHNWVQYHAQTGGYDVTVQRDDPASTLLGRRNLYRYQIQGPRALEILRKASAGTLPEIKFFNIGAFTIDGHAVRALRHGMAGAPGLEIFGPWEERDAIHAAVLEAGQEFGLRQVGMRAYPSTTLESGWIPVPLPAIFTGDDLKPYRQWLSATSFEAMASMGGSFYSEDISDYYLGPYELGYGSLVKFDHDFIGRQALEAMSKEPRRRKVTLAWDPDDVVAAVRTLLNRGDAAKYMDPPYFSYANWHYDKVLRGGRLVGLSMCSGYSYNERATLSLAMVDPDVAIGTEVALVWGESDEARSSWGNAERHVPIEISALVSPCPYSEVARTTYAPGWRSKAAAT
jgi:vanillate/3-O-methylgallate O-demethylase